MPVVIRVSDEDQALIPHVEVSRAIGFIKAKARQLTPIMWREAARRRNNLPNRTFYYAMPGSEIKVIELKTNPREQSWHARIIGGGVRVGDLIMIPTDNAVGARPQILVQSAGTGGPYEVFREPDLVAGNFDWKGRTRTLDFDGDPLPRPITDIITWAGPSNRIGPTFTGLTFLTTDTFKDGALYAVAPGVVVASSIQAESLATPEGRANRRHVVITNVDTATGGPSTRGTATWSVYIRPEELPAAMDRDPGLFDPDTNPNGWKLIGTLSSPNDFNGQRWQRMRAWYFNISGRQCSAMIPVNTPSDPALVRYSSVPATPGEFPNVYPMRSRLMSIDIDAFAETVALNDEGVEPTITSTVATVVDGCDDDNPLLGVISASTTTTWDVGPVFSRRISVDYKGNTRVFARAVLSSSGTDIQSGVQDSQGSFILPALYDLSRSRDVTTDWQIVFGTVAGVIESGFSTSEMTVTGEATSPSGSLATGDRSSSGGGVTNPFPGGRNKILYADLRDDVLILSIGQGNETTAESSTPVGISSGGTNQLQVAFTPWDRVQTQTVSQEAYSLGNLVASYSDEDIDVSTNFNFLFGGTVIGDNCPILEGNSDTDEFEFDISVESFQRAVEDLGFGFDGHKESYAATDAADNTALSVRTFSGRDIGSWVATGVEWINFIQSNTEPPTTLIEVMNQIEHVLPGPDGDLGTEDDIILDPVADDGTGRGVLIKVL